MRKYNNTTDIIDRVAELITNLNLLTTTKDNESLKADKNNYPSNDLVNSDSWASELEYCVYY